VERHTDVVGVLLDEAVKRHGGGHRYGGNGTDEDAHANIVGEEMRIVNAKDASGSTALHLAIREGKAGVVRIILQHKAVHMAVRGGRTCWE
jgi:ankyrin repeat protein